MNYLEIDKHKYGLSDTIIVTIYPGKYIDSCFGLQIKNLETWKQIDANEFSVCADVITTVEKVQSHKISPNNNYQSGTYTISIIPEGKKLASVEFNKIEQSKNNNY
jgi:hypothetical protein